MLDLRLRHVGVYRHAETHVQRAEHIFLGFTVGGVIYTRGPGRELTASDAPYVSLLLAGETTEFSYGSRRENWVIQLDSRDVRPDPDRHEAARLRSGGGWISVPRIVRLRRDRIPLMRDEFQAVREAFVTPVPLQRARAEFGVLAILRTFLDAASSAPALSPAQELKRLIDEDVNVSESIESLSQRVGYSPDHLRKKFEREFRVSPLRYRNQRRMALVMDLVADSRLSVKEIAARTGFRHVSHLSASFKKAYGITPREGIEKYRYGGGSASRGGA